MTDKPLFRAFVSSTSVDLKEHRARVIATLRRSGFHVDPMEDWTADDREPKTFSQERMDGCHLCLLLVAFRRGCVPDGETLSITQMEYAEAVRRGIAVLPFLLGDKEPWWGGFDERKEDPGVRAWREELQKRYGCGTFSLQPESLDVGPAVTRWVQERAAHAIGPAPASAQSFDFGPYLEAKRQHFVGRQWLFDEIDAWRHTKGEQALLITGDPGIGKSAIVAELVHRNPGGQVLAHHCCRADTPSTLQPAALVRSVAAMIASRLPGYAAQMSTPAVQEALSEGACASDPLKAFETGILVPLNRSPQTAPKPCFLLVDALDEALALGPGAAGLTIVQFFAAALRSFPPWLRLVATTRKERSVLDRLRGLRARELDAQDPRNLDDIGQYIGQRLRGEALARSLAASRHSAAQVADVLQARSSGNFLYVQQVLEAVEHGLYRFDQLDTLPPGLYGLYLGFFERHFPTEASYAPVKSVLQVVVAAREPLTREQIAEAAGLDAEEELPALLRRLASYLPERARHYAVYHKSLADWLTEPELAGSLHHLSRRKGHQRLAELGWAAYRRGPRTMTGYALRHLPHHLVEARRWEDLEALLADLAFLESKAESGLVFDLAEDFAEAVRQMPVERPWRRLLWLLEEALRRDLHFLARHPQALFQCLWNSCWWYDCPQAAQHYEPPEGSWPAGGPPWEHPGPKLFTLLESWRAGREGRSPGACWLRSLRPPPTHLGTALCAVLQGHEGEVTSVAFSGDGRYIVSGAEDGTVRVWDSSSGKTLHCLQGQRGAVHGVAVTPDGQRVVAAVGDGFLQGWDTGSGQKLLEFRGHYGVVRGVAVAPDGQWAVSGGGDYTVCVWEMATGREFRRFRSPGGWITGVAISPDGARIVSAASQGTLVVWDAATGSRIADLGTHEGQVRSIAFSPNGDSIACAAGTAIVLRDSVGGRELQRLMGPTQPTAGVAYSPDGTRVVSGAEDGTVRVWDVGSGHELVCLRGHEKGVRSVAVSPDGRWIASGSRDGTVRQWSAQAGEKLAPLILDKEGVEEVRFSPDGKWAITTLARRPRTVYVWDAASGSLMPALAGHSVGGVRFSPDGRELAAWLGDGTVRLVDAQTGQERLCLRGAEGPLQDALYSADGPRLFAWDQRIYSWDTEHGTLEVVFRGHTGRVAGVRLSPDEQRLASWAEDNSIRVWDGKNGQARLVTPRVPGPVRVAFSQDGTTLLCWGRSRVLQAWDTRRGEALAYFQEIPGTVLHDQSALGYQLGGGIAYTCDEGNNVVIVENRDDYSEAMIYEQEMTTEKGRLHGHEGAIYYVSYSPDKKDIVTAAEDRTIRVWDARSGQPVASMRDQPGTALKISYSCDGRQIAVWASDNTLSVFDTHTGRKRLAITYTEELKTFGFTPDGRRVVAVGASLGGSKGWTLQVWDMESGLAVQSVEGVPPAKTSAVR